MATAVATPTSKRTLEQLAESGGGSSSDLERAKKPLVHSVEQTFVKAITEHGQVLQENGELDDFFVPIAQRFIRKKLAPVVMTMTAAAKKTRAAAAAAAATITSKHANEDEDDSSNSQAEVDGETPEEEEEEEEEDDDEEEEDDQDKNDDGSDYEASSSSNGSGEADGDSSGDDRQDDKDVVVGAYTIDAEAPVYGYASARQALNYLLLQQRGRVHNNAYGVVLCMKRKPAGDFRLLNLTGHDALQQRGDGDDDNAAASSSLMASMLASIAPEQAPAEPAEPVTNDEPAELRQPANADFVPEEEEEDEESGGEGSSSSNSSSDDDEEEEENSSSSNDDDDEEEEEDDSSSSADDKAESMESSDSLAEASANGNGNGYHAAADTPPSPPPTQCLDTNTMARAINYYGHGICTVANAADIPDLAVQYVPTLSGSLLMDADQVPYALLDWQTVADLFALGHASAVTTDDVEKYYLRHNMTRTDMYRGQRPVLSRVSRMIAFDRLLEVVALDAPSRMAGAPSYMTDQ
jgi:hypothetical protein